MTHSQKLIDAAAKVHYERENAFHESHGIPYIKWNNLSQRYKEDLIYPAVIGPVTVALRAAVEAAKECDAYSCGQATIRDNIANVISSLIPQEPLGSEFEAVWDANTDKLHEP
jgi:hypothetical protein